MHASPIATEDRLYITSRDGVTMVVATGAELEILATNRLDDVLDATPAVVGNGIFLRGRSYLYCVATED